MQPCFPHETVSIWFYSSRGSNCCLELRALIDAGAGQVCPGAAALALPPPAPVLAGDAFCTPSFNATALPADELPPSEGCPPVGACLGYAGNCGDLAEQFATVQGCYVYGDPGAEEPHDTLADYVCHAFPDDAYVTDQFFVGLSACAARQLVRTPLRPFRAYGALFVLRVQSASQSRCP